MLRENDRRVRAGVTTKPRSGVRAGFRLATLLLLRVPEVRAALGLREGLAASDPDVIAKHLDMEPSYLRRVLRELTDDGLATVVEIPSGRGGPPHKSYGIDVRTASARVANGK